MPEEAVEAVEAEEAEEASTGECLGHGTLSIAIGNFAFGAL